ncbi:O-antigen ligase family protein [Lamprocystis purpurea]|uniref:O-antigen ligase family protein n=1 Tax=Lamprocystis purpurea TaxID=61598 RepID=UPI00037F580A|nr:O-antigen ligase family protein [Lamprocystis purpurea]
MNATERTSRPILSKPVIARGLLLIFAFTAWSITGPANVALALLVALFLTEIPGQWRHLRREPAFLLLLAVVLVTSLLAVRAAWIFPAIATDQWRAISAWSAPLLFFVIAWWLRRDPTRIWPVLGAAALGLACGVLRKSDWSLLPEILGGMRYDFGFAALGLAFLASVVLVGLVLFCPRITGLRIGGRARPGAGWIFWSLGIVLSLFVLVVTQSRGAAMSLALAGVLYAIIRRREARRRGQQSPRQLRLALAAAALAIALAGALLWVTKHRQVEDWQAITVGSQEELSYTGSVTIRLNLIKVGFQTFAQQPLLGFGPGTSTTEFLVPERVVAVDAYQLANAPAASHLHSVAMEILTRFGLVGVLIATLLLWVLLRAYRGLWSDPRAAPDLRAFLTLGGIMLLLYCLYDFRVVNLDLRFFCILFLGVLYSFQLGRVRQADGAEPAHD